MLRRGLQQPQPWNKCSHYSCAGGVHSRLQDAETSALAAAALAAAISTAALAAAVSTAALPAAALAATKLHHGRGGCPLSRQREHHQQRPPLPEMDGPVATSARPHAEQLPK